MSNLSTTTDRQPGIAATSHAHSQLQAGRAATKGSKTMTTENGKWERVGVCAVDSGTIMFGDPCYQKDEPIPGKDWKGFCNAMGDKDTLQLAFKRGHEGLGVAISGFGGDGCYPVYVKRSVTGMVIEAKIVFE